MNDPFSYVVNGVSVDLCNSYRLLNYTKKNRVGVKGLSKNIVQDK